MGRCKNLITLKQFALCIFRDRIILVFEFGPYPSIPKGTRAALKIGSGGRLSADKSEWEAVVYKESGNTLILEVGGFRYLKAPFGGIFSLLFRFK